MHLNALTPAELARPQTARLLAALEEADATYLRAPSDATQEFTLALMTADGDPALALRRHGQTVQAWVTRLGMAAPVWPEVNLQAASEDVTDAVAHVLDAMTGPCDLAGPARPALSGHRWP